MGQQNTGATLTTTHIGILATLAATLVGACSLRAEPATSIVLRTGLLSDGLATLPCNDSLNTAPLNGERIRVFNWNIRKNPAALREQNLLAHLDAADFVLLQEAVADNTPLHDDLHMTFARGFSGFGNVTGALTASRSHPQRECKLRQQEPWLRSPKASAVAYYPLANSDLTLLVVNTHIVNFTVGLDAVERQLAPLLLLLDQHDGPVIFSGDFNTWRNGRTDLIDGALRHYGLQPVNFADDQRVRFMGSPLDHIYVRGLRQVSSTTLVSGASDHNPLFVELELLLDEVGRSNCTFIRNGSEHTADEAAAHLWRKLRKAGDRIDSSESFIDVLASESSWTGRPYLVRCPERAPHEILSRDWLRDLLQDIRRQKSAT